MSKRQTPTAAPLRARQPWRWMPFGLRLRIARVRASLGRRRRLRRVVGVAVIAIGVLVLASASSGWQAERARWGRTAPVAVVRGSIEVGDTIEASDVEFISMPVALIPFDAVDESSLAGSAAVALSKGDVLRLRDLASVGSSSLPDGHRALAIPLGPQVPQLAVGDPVDVFVFDDAFGAGVTTAGASIPGRTIEMTEEAVIVAVPAADAGALAAGVANGSVVLAAA